jgi:hypothetical protein
VSTRKFHEIWIEQCDAAQEIKRRYGLKAAFDYVFFDEKNLRLECARRSDLAGLAEVLHGISEANTP